MMGMKRLEAQRILVFALAFVMLLAPGSTAATVKPAKPAKPAKPKKLRLEPVQLKAGTLRGVVKGYTGKPFANTTIELLDPSGKLVAKSVTNTRGEYLLRNVPPGRYTAIIGGRTELPITMTDQATVSRLMIVPRYAGSVPAPSAAGTSSEGFLGLSTWAWVAIGGGVVAAVAIPIALSGGGGGSSSSIPPPISP